MSDEPSPRRAHVLEQMQAVRRDMQTGEQEFQAAMERLSMYAGPLKLEAAELQGAIRLHLVEYTRMLEFADEWISNLESLPLTDFGAMEMREKFGGFMVPFDQDQQRLIARIHQFWDEAESNAG